MKIKLGFETNSSSTAHILMWRGPKTKERLRELLEAHSRHFDLTYEDSEQTRKINPREAIDAIVSHVNEAVPAKPYAAERMAIAKHMEDEDDHSSAFYTEFAQSLKSIAREAKEFDHVLTVSFGDNEGDYAGTDLGFVMDYEGRDIRIRDKDLFYTTLDEH